MADPVPDVAADTKTVRQGLPVGYARLVGHFAYYQAPEACYICTLLGALSAAEAEAAMLREALEQIANWRYNEPTPKPFKWPVDLRDVARTALAATNEEM